VPEGTSLKDSGKESLLCCEICRVMSTNSGNFVSFGGPKAAFFIEQITFGETARFFATQYCISIGEMA
jgi:hypothetical protein